MELLKELHKIFCKVFEEEEEDIELTDETTADDIEGWDSLSHVNLIVAIERHYKIKFETKELLTFKNVGDLRKSIENKMK